MSAWDALMWRTDPDPRTRSSGILLELLATEPDWDRLVAAHERVTAAVPRLRDRVVEPPVPIVQPRWSPDPDFAVTHHLHATRLAEPGSSAQLLQFCQALIGEPFDRSRPPWQAHLVTGLAHGKAAYVLKIHHSLTDGLGLIQLLELVHSDRAEPGAPQPVEPRSAMSRPLTPGGVLADGVLSNLAEAPAGAYRHAAFVASELGGTLREPSRSVSEAAGFVRSLGRMLQPPSTPRSELLRGEGGLGCRLVTVEVPLDRLRAAARAADASVNDAFLSAVLGGMRIYHEIHGTVVDRLPIGIPISLRSDDSPLGGNKFAGARFAAPLSEMDPVVRMLEFRDFVRTARAEPAISFVNALSPAVTKLPAALIVELSARMTASSDLQISNIRGVGHPLFIAGVEIEAMYPIGPRPGIAAMITMITYNGVCCIGLNVDPDAFVDPDVLEQCLRDGFQEVFDVAATGEGTP
jgi:WS/DGAT/MGAT family acyltransferase